MGGLPQGVHDKLSQPIAPPSLSARPLALHVYPFCCFLPSASWLRGWRAPWHSLPDCTLVTLFRQNLILKLAFNLSVKSTLEIDPSGVVLQNNLVSRKRPAGATRGFGTLYDTYEEAVQVGLACGSRRKR